MPSLTQPVLNRGLSPVAECWLARVVPRGRILGPYQSAYKVQAALGEFPVRDGPSGLRIRMLSCPMGRDPGETLLAGATKLW